MSGRERCVAVAINLISRASTEGRGQEDKHPLVAAAPWALVRSLKGNVVLSSQQVVGLALCEARGALLAGRLESHKLNPASALVRGSEIASRSRRHRATLGGGRNERLSECGPNKLASPFPSIIGEFGVGCARVRASSPAFSLTGLHNADALCARENKHNITQLFVERLCNVTRVRA